MTTGPRRQPWIALAFLTGVLCSCASPADKEAQQLAWTGPGLGPCVFGGVTEQAEEHCALLRAGPVGQLRSVNTSVREQLDAHASCQEHVEAVREALAGQAKLKTERLYTCPRAVRGRDECHVSVLVTLDSGARYVLDNGAVITDVVGQAAVTDFDAFSREVDGVYWLGFPPSAEDFAALDRPPEIARACPDYGCLTALPHRPEGWLARDLTRSVCNR